MTTAIATGLTRTVDPVYIPDGVYPGIWGGYRVRFTVAGTEYRADTSEGIRTQAAECTVTVSGGQITVEAK